MEHPWITVGSLEDISLDEVDAVAADIDHTLVDFDRAHEKAIAALSEMFGARFANMVHGYFSLILEGSRRIESDIWDRRTEYESLIARIAEKQNPTGVYGMKKWSRETGIDLANDELPLTLGSADIQAARDTYWRTLGTSAVLYPDAVDFLKRLDQQGIPLVLMTASDSVLELHPEEGFRYEPVFSRSYKAERLSHLPLHAAHIVIGDPADKPHPLFFDQVDDAVLQTGTSDHARVIAVGDSPRSDLEEPAKRGYQSYHIKRL